MMALVSPKSVRWVLELGPSGLMDKYHRDCAGWGWQTSARGSGWDGASRVKEGMLLASQEPYFSLKAKECLPGASSTSRHSSPTRLPHLTLFSHYSRTFQSKSPADVAGIWIYGHRRCCATEPDGYSLISMVWISTELSTFAAKESHSLSCFICLNIAWFSSSLIEKDQLLAV